MNNLTIQDLYYQEVISFTIDALASENRLRGNIIHITLTHGSTHSKFEFTKITNTGQSMYGQSYILNDLFIPQQLLQLFTTFYTVLNS